ncbi:hypothetical protein D8B26_005277 [Coccidioides posadasii str. Silveira]|uniref:uncharacterized protein n=1 Tax=Coccidioides posadasii (strain RMSCC 757 / Silveira) TaxID=443226 RepID=UPI001BF14A29|nr:hypothetical protein D8B26_005277 [Coccidioides posadasii str. Silveira]
MLNILIASQTPAAHPWLLSMLIKRQGTQLHMPTSILFPFLYLIVFFITSFRLPSGDMEYKSEAMKPLFAWLHSPFSVNFALMSILIEIPQHCIALLLSIPASNFGTTCRMEW